MEAIFIIALCILGFGLVSGRIENSIVTPAMVFVTLGLLLGRWGLGVLPYDVETPLLHVLAEITLVLVLFTDASRIDLRLLVKQHNLPVRLLAIGLPLTIVAGTLVAVALIGGISIYLALLLAAILAPTDAALGQAVVNSPRLPIRIRQTLNVESGLNDGIALPLVLLFLSLAGGEGAREADEWIGFAAGQLVLGPIAGVVVGYVGGKLVVWGQHNGWINQSFQDLSSIGLSLLAYTSAELIGGNGFIAAFCAGLTVGNSARSICSCLYEFAEAEVQLLTLLVFMAFGAILVPDALEHLSVMHLVYAAASLTIVRMVPVAISLTGSGLGWRTVTFLGWFGPRGIASILYALLLLEGSTVPGIEIVLSIIMTTVLLSVYLHGVTAVPATNWYADYVARMNTDAPEHVDVQAMPVRIATRDGHEA